MCDACFVVKTLKGGYESLPPFCVSSTTPYGQVVALQRSGCQPLLDVPQACSPQKVLVFYSVALRVGNRTDRNEVWYFNRDGFSGKALPFRC
eukprot:g54983.t1